MKGTPGEGIIPRAMKTYIEKVVREKTQLSYLTPSCSITLCSISENEGCSLYELSENMLVDKSLITRNVKTLMKNGLVENRNTVKNKYSLYLTDEGKNVTEKTNEIVKEAWNDIFSVLTEEENELFEQMSVKIAGRLNELLSKGGEK